MDIRYIFFFKNMNFLKYEIQEYRKYENMNLKKSKDCYNIMIFLAICNLCSDA